MTSMIRVLDITFSLLSIVFLLPLFMLISIVLFFTGEGEILYMQKRVGLGGTNFHLFKFATMLRNSEKMGTGTITIKNDPRVLPFGRFLRKSKINELPQIFNVLFGDMSLIGPRPQTRRCFDAFPISSQNKIINVLPGLSGIGSIVFRDEEELMAKAEDPDSFYDNVVMPYKGMLEEWYVENISVKNYFMMIIFTLLSVVLPKSKYIEDYYSDLPQKPQELKTV